MHNKKNIQKHILIIQLLLLSEIISIVFVHQHLISGFIKLWKYIQHEIFMFDMF